MKARKSIVAVILTLCMILCCAAPIFANADSSNLSVSADKTTVEIDETVTVTLKLVGNPELASLNGGIAFDTDAFECTKIVDAYGDEDSACIMYKKGSRFVEFYAGALSSLTEANTNGTVGFSCNVSSTDSPQIKPADEDTAAIIVVTFKALKAGTAEFKAYEDSSTFPAGGTYAFKGDGNKISVTVNAPAVTEYTVTFDPDNGEAVSTVQVEEGQPVAEPSSNPTKEGAQFKEWQKDGAAYDFSSAVTGNITIKAVYDPLTFNVTFTTEHGTAPTKQIIEWGKTASDPGALTDDAYEFDGWFTTADGDTKFDFSTQIKADTEVFAHWTKKHVHAGSEVPAKEVSCTEDGNKAYYVCDECGKKFTDDTFTTEITDESTIIIKAEGHKYSEPEYIWSGDKTTATAKTKCSVCGDEITETVNTTKEETPATCEEDGKIVYTAAFTKDPFVTKTEEETITKLGHDLTPTEAKAATCEEDGNIAYWTCKTCEKLFKDEAGTEPTTAEDVVIPAKGHTADGAPVITWTGETADGAKATADFVCSECGNTVTVDATMTVDGNIVEASAKIDENGDEYTDLKHFDSAENKTTVSGGKDAEGNEVKLIYESGVNADEIIDSILLDAETAAAVDSELKADELTVIWQKNIVATDSVGEQITGKPVTITFKVENVGDADKIYVFHYKNGAWVIEFVGEEGASEVTVEFKDGLSPVALVLQSVIPQTGDNSELMLWASVFVLAAACTAVAAKPRKKGKHEA